MKGLTRVFATSLPRRAADRGLRRRLGARPRTQSRKHHSTALKVRILQKKQEAILKHGLQVKVVSGKARKVRLRAFSSTFDEGSKRLTKTRMVRFRKGGRRSVSWCSPRPAAGDQGLCRPQDRRQGRQGEVPGPADPQHEALPPARNRPEKRRQMRLRHELAEADLGLHGAVPRRLLHEGRPEHRNRPQDQLPDRSDARQRAGPAHRSGALQRLQRLQPGLDDPPEDPRHRNRRRRQRDRRPADQPHRPLQRRELAGRRDRRQHRRTLADLDRDRLGRQRPLEGADGDPSRRSTSNPGTATSSPCATSRTRPGRRSKRRRRSATSATKCPPNRSRSTNSAGATRASSRP